MFIIVRRRFHRLWGICNDFVNLKMLFQLSISKMLIEARTVIRGDRARGGTPNYLVQELEQRFPSEIMWTSSNMTIQQIVDDYRT